MASIAHLGIGLGAKKVLPQVNVAYLLLASEAVEIVFMALWVLGIERPPSDEMQGFSPYSHSVIGGLVISVIVGLTTWGITKNKKHVIVMSLLTLSHTVIDVIASPMTAFYPTDVAKPILFEEGHRIGFGLWRYKTLAMVLEFTILTAGAIIYILTKKKLKRIERNS